MRREHRALTRLALGRGIEGIPRALDSRDRHASRAAGSTARPCRSRKPRDPAYFRAAARLLRRLHAANVIHNDLAKETNWLVTPDGRPALVDFQLAMTLDEARRRSPARSVTTTSATCSSTSAPICPSGSPRARSAFSPRRRWSRASGWRAARRSIYSSRAGSSAGAIARARAIAERERADPAHMRRGRIWIL